MSTRFSGIDLLRPLAAFGIVALHFAQAVEVDESNPVWPGLFLLRDFALPFFIVVSVFLSVQPLLGAKASVGELLRRRFQTLGVPFLFWNTLHVALLVGLLPLLLNIPAGEGSLTEYLTGYRHLWFLSFVFVGLCLVIPPAALFAGRPQRWSGAGWVFVVLAVALQAIRPLFADIDPRLHYLTAWLPYLPLGAGLAFLYAAHRDRFTWRFLGLVAVGLTTVGVIFGLWRVIGLWHCLPLGAGAVLLALLPWPVRVTEAARPLSNYTYGLYIVHLLVALAFREICRRAGMMGPILDSPARIYLASLVCFIASGMVAVVGSRLLARYGWEMLLPGAPARTPRETPQTDLQPSRAAA